MALRVWVRWATQLESDLLEYYNLDIADWHQGTELNGRLILSSRRLLSLAETLCGRDGSEMQKALSESGWPEWVQMLAKMHEDGAMLRASKFAKSEFGEWAPFLAPNDRKPYFQQIREDAEQAGDLLESLFDNN